MKTKIYLSLLLIALLGCEKESVTPKNHLKATIDGKQITIFDDLELNDNDPSNTFSFSFGQIITTEVNSTEAQDELYISACLNRHFLRITFPKPTSKTSYTIYRGSNRSAHPKAHYSLVYDKPTNLETFHTSNMLNCQNVEKVPVGEITIKKIDMKNRIIEGQFNFSAYSYAWVSDKYTPTNKTVKVTNGEFYYQWDEELDIK